jgi:hypothetical protein
MMRTEQLREALRKHPITQQYFEDVYASDQLPPLVKGRAYVVNTHPSDMPGEHWFALYRGENGAVTFMDSFGRVPPKQLARYRLTYDCTRFQGLQPICGQYCLMFVLAVQRPRVLNCLDSQDLLCNDRLVRRFAWREFGVK